MDLQQRTKALGAESPSDASGGPERGPDFSSLRLWLADFPNPVLAADASGRVVFLNRKAEEVLGFTLAEKEQPVWKNLLKPEACGDDLMETCLRCGCLDDIPVRLEDRLGRRLPCILSASSIKNEAGDPSAVLAVLRSIPAAGLDHETPAEAAIEAGGAPVDAVLAGGVDATSEAPAAASVQEEIAATLDAGVEYRAALLSAILDNFPTPFLIVDPDLTVVRMNQQMEMLTGYAAEETLGRMTCADLLSSSRCNTEECPVKKAVAFATPVEGLCSAVIDRQGRTIPVVVNAAAVVDREQRLVAAFKAIRDTSSLAEAEQKIYMLTELSQEGILLVDEESRVIFANDKMEKILGHSKQELVGMHTTELLPIQHQTMVNDLIERVDREHPKQLSFCTTIQPVKGSSRDYKAYETCVAASRVGRTVITCMFFFDLTYRIEIERQLRHTNSFLNNIIRSSVDGIMAIDTRGNVLIFNEGAENILGYKADEIIGHADGFSKICSPTQARENMRRMRSSEYGPPGKLNSTQINVLRKDGTEVPVNFSAAIITEGGTEIGSVGIFSDLRDRLRMMRELEEARIQLLQAEKIASLGRLAAGVAHEINNPLAGILIYADMLMRDLRGNPQWAQDMEEIIQQTLRCKQIVNRLLEFSRQSKGKKMPVSLNHAIGQCVQLLSHQALFHDIQFNLDLQQDLPKICGDSGQLQQVFTNLIINAADAMSGRGVLSIRGRFNEETRHAVLEFGDTGHGIPSEVQDKLFEPFFTTKAPGEGTGLGLSVVYGIVRQHGGTIEARNLPEGGAVFVVILPLEPPDRGIDIVDD